MINFYKNTQKISVNIEHPGRIEDDKLSTFFDKFLAPGLELIMNKFDKMHKENSDLERISMNLHEYPDKIVLVMKVGIIDKDKVQKFAYSMM